MQQFANGKVNGDLQVVLYQLYLPATAICSRLYLRNKLSVWNIIGGILVFGGCALVAVPDIGPSDSIVWPCVYALSAVPLGMACVLQEEIFKEFPNCTVLKMSTWSTIYGVAFNVLTLPVSMLPNAVYKDVTVGNSSEMVAIYPHGATWDDFTTHQYNAFKCFFGWYGTADGSGSDMSDPLPDGCAVDAWRAVMIYVVSYGINVFVCMALVKEMSAVFCVVFGAAVLPTTTICFSIGALTVRTCRAGLTTFVLERSPRWLGSHAPIDAFVDRLTLHLDWRRCCFLIQHLYNAGDPEPITWNVAAGSAVCLVGLLTFKGDAIVKSMR